MHFYAKTCNFAYAPFKRYSYNRTKLTARELKIGAIIGTLFYSLFMFTPLMFLLRGELQSALMFSFVYPFIAYVFWLCHKEYKKEEKEKVVAKMSNYSDHSLYFSSILTEKEL